MSSNVIVARHEPTVSDDGRRNTPKVLDQRSEEHTSELQSPCNLVCRLLLEKKINHVCLYSPNLLVTLLLRTESQRSRCMSHSTTSISHVRQPVACAPLHISHPWYYSLSTHT